MKSASKKMNTLPNDYTMSPLTDEIYREYDFGGRVYKIEKPAILVLRKGGTTHRVVDSSGVVHCVPAPGVNGCVLRWQTKNPNKPVLY